MKADSYDGNSDSPTDWVVEAVVGPRAAQCTRCRQIKPQADFAYRLTRAQAHAQGYACTVRPLCDTGLVCSACRRKRKPAAKLNRKQLQNRIVHGDLTAGQARRIKDRLEVRIANDRFQGLENRWHQQYLALWQPTLSAISRELRAVQQAEKHVKHVHYAAGSPDVEPRLAFAVAYKLALMALRATLKHHYAFDPKTRAKPRYERWVDYFEDVMPTERRRLHDLWDAIPLATRVRLRLPAFANPAGDTALVPMPKIQRDEAVQLVRARAERRANEALYGPAGGYGPENEKSLWPEDAGTTPP